MLDLKALLTKILKKLTLSVVSNSTTLTISANGTAWITVPFPSGVTRSDIICLCGWYLENGWYLNIYDYTIGSTGATFALYNPSSSPSGTVRVHAHFLITNGGGLKLLNWLRERILTPIQNGGGCLVC